MPKTDAVNTLIVDNVDIFDNCSSNSFHVK